MGEIGSGATPPTEFTVQASVDAGRGTVVASGELDLRTAPQFSDIASDTLYSTGLRELVVDISGIEFLDSSGMGAMLGVQQLADTREIVVRWANVPPRISRLLTITGLASTFHLDAAGQ